MLRPPTQSDQVGPHPTMPARGILVSVMVLVGLGITCDLVQGRAGEHQLYTAPLLTFCDFVRHSARRCRTPWTD